MTEIAFPECRVDRPRLSRRDIVKTGLSLFALAGAPAGALAKDYPDRPIRMLVGFPPGQSTDLIARAVAAKMSEALGQTVYIDNKPGAAGIISHDLGKNAPPDGYTIVMGSQGTLAVNPVLYRKLPYNPAADFVPIATVIGAPFVLFTGAASPVRDLRGMIDYARRNPGKLTYGSPGAGTGTHIVMEMFSKAVGIDMVHVPYKGSPPMITDVIAGRVDVAFESAPAILGFAKTGQVNVLGVTSANRLPSLPDLPTLAEQGLQGFQVGGWTALVAPKGTPQDIVRLLNAAVNKALADPAVTAEFPKWSAYALPGSPADAQRFLEAETARWQKATRDTGAVAD